MKQKLEQNLIKQYLAKKNHMKYYFKMQLKENK